MVAADRHKAAVERREFASFHSSTFGRHCNAGPGVGVGVAEQAAVQGFGNRHNDADLLPITRSHAVTFYFLIIIRL